MLRQFLRGLLSSRAIARRSRKHSHPKGEERVRDNLSFCLRLDAPSPFYMGDAKSEGTGASKAERSDANASR
jgi:hypothetical protein